MKVVIDIPEIPKNDKQRWALANGTPYKERPHGQWIPCSERLPKKIGVYLVTTEEGKVFEYDYNILTVHLKKWSFCRKEIVAWMPLPEPYKEEGENDGMAETSREEGKEDVQSGAQSIQ